jgi:WS/DGAT/MGAT family acyltransferase
MSREIVSNMDSVFLHLDDPTNLMMITGVMILGMPVDRTQLKTTIADRLLSFDRFRQRVVESRWRRGTWYWADDPALDLDYHVQPTVLLPPGDQAALQAAVSKLASTPLDLSRPLWRFHLVETYDEGSALIFRLHHSLADGMGLVHVLFSLTDAEPDAAQAGADPEAAPVSAAQSHDRLLRRFYSQRKARRRRVRRLVRKGLGVVAHPLRLSKVARRGEGIASAVAKLALASPDPGTLLKGELGIPKRSAWSAGLPLEDVRTIGRRLGGTVNDVLLAAVTGALRRYLHDRGEPLQGAEFRATIPVDMRSPAMEGELGNHVGVYLLDLPLGIADRTARLQELKRRMDRIKGSPEAAVTFVGLRAVGRLSPRTQRFLVNLLGIKATAVMTNVRGPEAQLYLAGAPLEALLAWVPKAGGLGIGVSILSYAGQVRLGVITDAGLVPDPEAIVAGFQAEFDALLALARETKPTSAADLVAMLDGALATLDSMLEGDNAESDSPRAEARLRCQALTKSGRQCKNRALAGSGFCHVHA